MGNLFDELKRRNVFRVGIAYLVVGWLIIEIVDTVAPRLGLPEWVPTFFIVLVGVGFPVALLLAWAFELTPEGMKKTGDVDPEVSVRAATGQKINYLIIGLLVLALGYFIWESRLGNAPDTGMVFDKDQPATFSVAVLPFDNLSGSDEDNALADAMTEDILTSLSANKYMFVVARNSVLKYKGAATDIRDVGRDLGVRYVLEGSLRRMGPQIRFTAQLIDAESGAHLWSRQYDRPIGDIFAVQDEVTGSIAAEVEAEIAAAEMKRAKKAGDGADVPTRATNLLNAMVNPDKKGLDEAIVEVNMLITADPDNAMVHAFTAYLYGTRIAAFLSDNPEEDLTKAREAAARALQLDPGEQVVLRANSFAYLLAGEPEKALDYAQRALDIAPDNAQGFGGRAMVFVSLGRPEEALADIKETLRLSPHDTFAANFYSSSAIAQLQLGDYDAALAPIEKALETSPNAAYLHLYRALALQGLDRGNEARLVMAKVRELAHKITKEMAEERVRTFSGRDTAGQRMVDLFRAAWGDPETPDP